MMTFVRYLLGAIVLLLGLSAIVYMQERFDRADVKRAVEALQYRFPELKDCQALVESRFQGTVGIHCANDPRTWRVDVTRGLIQEEKNPTSPVSNQ